MTRKREEKEKEKQLSKKTRMSNSISKAESESLVLDNDPFDFLIDEPVYDYFSENSMLLHGISSSTSSSSSPYNYLSFFPWEKTLGAAVSSASSFKKKRRISKAESEPLISNQTLILCDDLLLEIFRRIPDSRSVIRCCAVCKRWRSLINSDEYKGFKQLDTFNLPYTLIFSLDEEGCQIYGYFSENSKLLHGISTSKTTSSRNKYWSFWPWKKVHIFSSFRDLLLVSPDKTFRRGRGVRRLLICNPLTKQFLQLHELPESLPYGVECSGLVLYENRQQNHQYNYKVMVIHRGDTHFDAEFTDYWAATFCSETRNWSLSNFSFPLPGLLNSNVSVACNGMLHCLEEHLESELVYRVVAFDFFKDSNHPKYFRFIYFPSDLLGQGEEEMCNPVTIRIGAVREQLRLSQLLLIDKRSVLKIWELNYNKEQDDDDFYPWSWTLVHDVEVRSIYKRITRKTKLFLVAFDPEDGDVVFLTRGFRGLIYRYDIGKEKMERVGKLPVDGNKIAPIGLRAYTLTHPMRPTLLCSSV